MSPKLPVLPVGPKWRARLVVVALGGSTVLATYLNGAYTVALPSIGDALNLEPEELQWPLTVLALTNGATLLIFGGVADAFGRRTTFLVGIVWLLVVSILTSFAKTGTQLIIASAVMGLGNALLTPASVGILGSAIPDGSFKNIAFACLGAGQAIGYIIGLVLGGVFAQHWQAIFYFMIAISALFGGLSILVLPADGEQIISSPMPSPHGSSANLTALSTPGTANVSRTSLPAASSTPADPAEPKWKAAARDFDYIGATLSTVGLVLLTFGLADAEIAPKAWATPYIPSLLSVSVIILIAFILWERRLERAQATFDVAPTGRRPRTPLLPPSIWVARRFSPLLSMVFFAWLAFNCLGYWTTLYLQKIQHTSPIATSIKFIPLVLAGIFCSIVSGSLVGRVSAFYMLLMGGVGVAIASVIFCIAEPSWSYWRGMFWCMLLQVAPDLAFPGAQLFAVRTVGARHAALAGSLFNTTIKLATSLGLAITSSVSTSVIKRYASQHGVVATDELALLQGYRAAGWACFASSCAAVLITLIWTRDLGIVGGRDPKNEEVEEAASRVGAVAPAGESIALAAVVSRQQTKKDGVIAQTAPKGDRVASSSQ